MPNLELKYSVRIAVDLVLLLIGEFCLSEN